MRATSDLPATAFVDTSYLFACIDPADAHHTSACDLAGQVDGRKTACLTTWDVVSETATLLLYRTSQRSSIRFLDEVLPRLRIVDVDASLHAAALEQFRRFNRGRGPRISLCDAVTYCVLTRMLEGTPCLAFDRGLRAIGLHMLP